MGILLINSFNSVGMVSESFQNVITLFKCEYIFGLELSAASVSAYSDVPCCLLEIFSLISLFNLHHHREMDIRRNAHPK